MVETASAETAEIEPAAEEPVPDNAEAEAEAVGDPPAEEVVAVEGEATPAEGE